VTRLSNQTVAGIMLSTRKLSSEMLILIRVVGVSTQRPDAHTKEIQAITGTLRKGVPLPAMRTSITRVTTVSVLKAMNSKERTERVSSMLDMTIKII
jgi:hypothetical protein